MVTPNTAVFFRGQEKHVPSVLPKNRLREETGAAITSPVMPSPYR